MLRRISFCAALLLASCAFVTAAAAQSSFITFESGPVRPMALSADGTRLYVANTPDNRLELFAVTAQGLVRAGSIPVGMEPVAVAERNGTEVWVVNHLSDSVSVIDIVAKRVVRTLLVGDEPRDIVFAGTGGNRAFITTAHRGQQRSHASISGAPGAGDPQLTTAGVARADVWVFDATDLDQGSPTATLGGVPEAIVELFGDTPRALAVSPDGNTVYAAVFHSGNQTAVVSEGTVCDGFGGSQCGGDGISSPNGLAGGNLPGGSPGPSTNHEGTTAPEVGLIVQFDEASGEWRDESGRNWSNGIRFHLPDHDVFEIDANTLTSTVDHEHVGTILFNMAVNPVSGKVYVSNTDAQNLTRFEGPGTFGPTTVQGNLAQSRVTVISSTGVDTRHLNKHINYGTLPAPAGVKNHSLATPTDMVVSSDGSTLYVAAFGSSKVGVFDTGRLENDSFDPTVESANYLAVSGGGPAGLALDEAKNRLYVFTRFDNSVSVVDLIGETELNHIPLHNPEPAAVVDGRFMLYDALATSSNGEASCSSCHIFGDFDSLAWDLGDPDGDVTSNPMTIRLEIGAGSNVNGGAEPDEFHPMKGPMTTQTLRGMVNHGGMHWRGDRTNGFFGIDALDSDLSFRNFIVAFDGLVGGGVPPTDPGLQADMQLFSNFALQITMPPNPVRNLDNSLTPDQQAGEDFYLGNVAGGGHLSDGVPFGNLGFTCEGCHTLNPSSGFFGGNGFASFEAETQIVKIPQLRNVYQKVGMFGAPDVGGVNAGDNGHKGDQVRGTGFLHDGSVDTVFRFFQGEVFNSAFGGNVGFFGGNAQRSDVEEFMLAFDSDLAPIVGQQVTLNNVSGGDISGRIALMIARAGTSFASEILGAQANECDLVVKGRQAGEARGWAYDPTANRFVSDRSSEAVLTDAQLQDIADTPGQELTYTCAPPGSGTRMGIDRDEDGERDRDELDAGTNPDNPGSVLGACNDGQDNDGDGLTDLGDPGCQNAGASIENPRCSDGYDNDNDGLVDAADPQCTGTPWKNLEATPSCGLGPGLAVLLGLLSWRGSRRRAV